MHVLACDRCHRRKVRCDKTLPQCTPCIKSGTECHYMTSEHQQRRRNTQKLERRIKELEAENKSLLLRLASNDISPPATSVSGVRSNTIQPTACSPLGSDRSGGGTIVEQVVHMSLIAGGSDHFVGSASGLLLANLIQTCNTSPSSLPSTRTHWNNTSLPAQLSDTIPPLPPKTVGRKLVQAYSSHDHLCYPYLSLEKLHESLEAVYDANSGATAFDEFTVNMALAIATAQVHKFNWNGIYDAELHYNRAMLKFGDVMVSGGTGRIQALLLICQYRMGSTSKSTTTSVWHLIGLASRMCLEMGLHRNTAYNPRNDEPTTDPGLADEVQLMELRRKCFWSLIALDRVTSIALGRPLAIQIEDVDLALPTAGACMEGLYDVHPDSSTRLDSVAKAGNEAIFSAVVSYRVLCGEILNALYRSPHNASSSVSNYEQIRQSLTERLHHWHVGTASLPLIRSDLAIQDEIIGSSCFRAPDWWRLLYINAMLLLYRPSPCLCDAEQSSTTLQQIFDASQEAISLYASLHRSKKMNYSWITMHSVFNAGLSYIYALRNHLQSIRNATSSSDEGPQAKLNPGPSITQVFNDTRACSKVLVAVSERWDAAKNCSDLFDKLSDAVISDIVETSSHSSTGTYSSTLDSLHRTQQTALEDSRASGDLVGGCYDQDAQTSFFQMAVDHTFRDCFGDLQDLALDEYRNDALSRLSHEWFLGLNEDL